MSCSEVIMQHNAVALIVVESHSITEGILGLHILQNESLALCDLLLSMYFSQRQEISAYSLLKLCSFFFFFSSF